MHKQITQSMKIGKKGSIGTYSPGDMQLSLHALRVDNGKLKNENKILKQLLKNIPDSTEAVPQIKDEIIENANALQNIARSLVNRLCELEIAYIDTNSEAVKLLHFEEMIVPKEALIKFYKKELDNAKSNVR